jgi:hypothetical protein
MPKDLYTQSEIKEEKTRLYLKQKGVDPILQEAIAQQHCTGRLTLLKDLCSTHTNGALLG